MISEKNERDDASSSCSNSTNCQHCLVRRNKRPTFRVLVTKSPLSHVGHLDSSLWTGIHEEIAAGGVKFWRRYDLRQLLHIRRFDVHDVETLILNVKIPQVDSEIVTADKRLSIAIYRYAVDMISVRICVCPSRHGRNNRVMMRHSREFQGRCILERNVRGTSGTTTQHASRREIMRQVILRHDLQRLVKHLPQLYRLVVGR